MPPNFEAEVQKEQTWLSFVTKKKAADRRPDAAQRAQLKRALRGVHEKEPTALEQVQAQHAGRLK